MIEKRKALTAEPNDPEKIDPEEQLPDLPEQELPDPELPDLTRLHKRRCRDENVIKKAKSLLVHGMTVSKVALLLRLPLEKVQQLHSEGWNSRCRRVTRLNAYQNAKLALTSFNEGVTLAEICQALGLPLYTVVMSLRQNGVAESAIQARLPPADDPLILAYNIVAERKSTSRFKPIRLHSNRSKLHPATVATTQRTSSQTATAESSSIEPTLNLIDILSYLPIIWLAYCCTRDGQALLRKYKNEDNIAKSERRNRRRTSWKNSRTIGGRTARVGCKKRR